MSLKLFLTSLILLINSSSFATVTVTDLTGYSNLEGLVAGDSTASQNIVFGGVSGDDNVGDCATKTSGSTCNNCNATGSFQACNATRIHDGLLLNISFRSDSTSGRVLITTDTDTDQDSLTYSSSVITTSTTVTAGNTVTVSVLWGHICETLFGGTGGCGAITATDLSSNLRIGFEPEGSVDGELSSSDDYAEIQISLADINKQGLTSDVGLCLNETAPGSENQACNFIIYPGDQKVFIDDVRVGCAFPDVPSSDAEIKALRVFYEIGTYPTKATATYSDLTVTDSTTTCGTSKIIGLSENEVKGLENNETYFFSLALLDEANNVGFFTKHLNTLETDSDTCYDSDQWEQNCHIAATAPVVGLLEDEFDCFITTATYGSPFKAKVKIFRKFRNLFLKPSLLGQLIMQSYYTVSPPIARWIRNHPDVKPFVRIVLWPFWLVAKVFLFMGSTLFFLIIFLSFALGFSFKRKWT